MVKILLAVFLGSGLGGVCRYLLSESVASRIAKSECLQTGLFMAFPWGTLIVNILGCFLIGLFYGLIDRNLVVSQEMRLLLTTGFCGGLTTFSTFSNENLLLFNSNNHLTLLLYVAVSVISGFVFALLGHWIVK